MTTTIEYALMAGASYISTRNEINRFPVPQGWTSVIDPPYLKDDATGFEAIAFQRGTEIVISYSGTDPNNWNLFTTPDGMTNAALSAGKWADQLLQAAEYYLQIKATNPLATKITLTGHSLGGGLAALVGVFFDVRATTFNQAPFAASARFDRSDDNWRSNAEDLLARLSAKYDQRSLEGLTEYVRLLNLDIFSNVIPRADRVDTIRVDKEILQGGIAGARPFGNLDETLTHGSATGSVARDDLHSQALLAAFLQSGDTPTSTASDHTLGQVSFKLTDLLKMFFDKNLFATDAATREPNFLDHLVRHEAGVRNPATGAITIAADAMVTRFTQDMWKLAQAGGMTMSDANLTDALIAFSMQKYYDEKPSSIGAREVLFKDVTGQGGIQFDFNAVAASLDKTKDAQSTGYFKRFLESNLFTADEKESKGSASFDFLST